MRFSRTSLVTPSSGLIALAISATALAQTPQTQYLGSWPYGPADAMTFDTSRNLAFVGDGGAVVVVDVTDPTAPARISDSIRSLGVVGDVALDPATDRLFVAAEEAGLEIWDVSTPASPQKLGSLGLTYAGVDAPANRVEVSGDYAYVSAGFGYLHAIDVSDPANPVDIGFDGQGGNPSGDLFLANGTLYLGGPRFSRYAVQPNGGLVLTGQNFYTKADNPFPAGNFVYATSNNDVLVFDATQTTLPTVSFYSFPNARDVWVNGSVAYVADVTGGIRVLDISNPANLVEIGSDPSVGESQVMVAGGRLWAVGSALFRALDISVPASPTEIGRLQSESLAYDVDMEGGHAYVADSGRGLYVLDVNDPAAPVETGHAPSPGAALDVDVDGQYAYVASQFAGLVIYDIQDPAAPAQVAAQPVPYYARGVFVRNGLAYVADLSNGLRVIDVSNPATPSEIGATGPNTSSHVFVQGDVAYVTNSSNGLGVVDVSDPTMPVQVTSIPSLSFANDIFVSGNRAYLADFAGGLRIFDLSSPLSPVEIGSWSPLGVVAGAVKVSGNTAYVMDAGDGLRVVDVTDPTSPSEIELYDTPGDAFQVFIAGSDLYVADGDAGVRVLRFGTATAAPLAEAGPGATRVSLQGGIARFALPSRGLGLRVFDVRGREVFSSRDRRDVSFAPDASGAYFWRVEGNGAPETGKVVVVR